MPDNIVPFTLPKKPRIKEKEPAPDQRKVAVLPIRALTDGKMTDGAFRALALLCSYCNRAGITWVSQTRLAKDMGVTQQAISKHFKQLRELGYIETVKKGFKGERSDTLRVIFDATVDAETAIAVTSRIEDTRPPYMQEEQQMQQDNDINHEGLKRIKDMIKGAVKPVQPPPKEYQMPKGDTAAVAKMKQEINAHKARKARPKAQPEAHSFTTSEVVHEEPLHSQPTGCAIHNSEVVDNTELTHKRLYTSSLLKEVKELNEGYKQLLHNSMTVEELEQTLQALQARCEAEGVPMPTDANLVEALLVLHADSL